MRGAPFCPRFPLKGTGTGPVSARATPRTPDDDRRPSARSLRGLDGLNFLMADVRDCLVPYLSVYLKGAQHWQPGDIGVAMPASSLSTTLCQIPAGLLVDALKTKRLLVAGSELGSAAVVNLINSSEIDDDLARGGAEVDRESGTNAQHTPIPIRDLLRQRDLIFFAALMPETRDLRVRPAREARRNAGAMA
jgi:hypothetical protein